MRPAAEPPGPEVRRAAAWLRIVLVGYLVFVAYGSWVPLDFHARPFAAAVDAFLALRLQLPGADSRSDGYANVLLGVPLGLLAAQVASRGGGRVGAVQRLGLGLALGLFSAGVEFGQIFFPPRTPSLSDVAAQVLGAAIGLGVQAGYGRRFGAWLAEAADPRHRAGRGRRLLGAYVLLLFLFSLLPLDLTPSPVEIFHKWREGRIVLLPFGAAVKSLPDAIYETLTDVLVWVPVGLFWAIDRGRAGPLLPLALRGMRVALLLEALQLFVWSRTSDVTDVLLAGVGVPLGAALVPLGAAFARLAPERQRRLRAAATLAWLAAVAVVFWFPFDFTAADASWAEARAALTSTPLAQYQLRTEFGALNELLRKALAFLPGGLLLGARMAGARAAGGRRPRWPLVALAVVAVGVEAGQLALPGKVADLTDALLEWLGGVAGVVLARWMGAADAAGAMPVASAPARAPMPPEATRLGAVRGGRGTARATAAAVLATAAALWLAARAPGVPYNVVKLLPATPAGAVAALGLAAAIGWLAVAPFALLDPRRRAALLLFPLALALHGLVAWALLRVSVPAAMVHKIIGDPVLGWPGPWEDIGRYLALHVAVVMQLLGALLCVRTVLQPRRVADLLHWAAVGGLLAWPLYAVVVDAAATDNLVELMAHGASFGAASALAGGVFLVCLAASAVSAASAGGPRRGTLLATCALAVAAATGCFWLGLEPRLDKYGRSFSAWQFILSASRDAYAGGTALAVRYAAALAGTIALLAALQFGSWRRLGSVGGGSLQKTNTSPQRNGGRRGTQS